MYDKHLMRSTYSTKFFVYYEYKISQILTNTDLIIIKIGTDLTSTDLIRINLIDSYLIAAYLNKNH